MSRSILIEAEDNDDKSRNHRHKFSIIQTIISWSDLQALAPADGAALHARGPARRVAAHAGAAAVAGAAGQD